VSVFQLLRILKTYDMQWKVVLTSLWCLLATIFVSLGVRVINEGMFEDRRSLTHILILPFSVRLIMLSVRKTGP